jgi:hypothetical protein
VAKRNAAPVRAATSERDLVEILAVTGDDPATLRRLIALCDAILAARDGSSVATEIDATALSVT